MPNPWDKKAKNYGRYTPGTDNLETVICQMMGEMGIDFSGRRVLDIGCGTGVYTLRVAQKASHIDALDISREMLKILDEDAARYGKNNIHTFHTDWKAFSLPSTPYDYALSTMSPATREAEGFAKMSRAATTKIFLGWGAKRGTVLLEELIASHGQTYTPPNGAVRLRSWLEAQRIPYRLREHPEEKIRIKPLQKAIETYAWHLRVRKLTPDLEKVEAILRRHQNADGNVVEKVVNYFNLIVWD